MKIASARPEPIPVYAEMSSINPVFLLPGALAARAEELGKEFVGSLTHGRRPVLHQSRPGDSRSTAPHLERFIAAATRRARRKAAGRSCSPPAFTTRIEKGVAATCSSTTR